MSRGRNKIEDSDRTGGFDVNPQNINKKGPPLSITNQLREILEQDGEMVIKPEHIIRENTDGSVVIKMPKRDMVAMKLLQWAMSKKGSDSLKAIQLISERLEGRPAQSLNISTDEPIIQAVLTDEQFNEAMKKLEPKEK